MVSGACPNYISAYSRLLAEVHELRQKIEDKKLTHNDILKIANSVLVQERSDGSISIKKRLYQDRNSKISEEQIALIRTICSIRGEAPNVQVKRGKENKPEEETLETSSKKPKVEKENVAIVRRGAKGKSKEQEDLRLPTPQIIEAKDIFRLDSNTPDALLGLMAEYIEESPSAIVDFAYNVTKKPIPGYLKGITHLDLSNERLTLATFKTIISEFKNLKSIKLPKDADDSWLEELGSKLKNLETLDVSYCKNIKNEGLGHITSNMKSLKNLNLSDCKNIGDEGVDRIFQELKIQNLNLCGCSQITDDAFKNVKESCDSLQVLNLAFTNISDKSIEYIANGIKGLKTIILYFCEKITDDAINLVIGELKELEYLDLSYTNVTDSGLVNLSQITKSLQSLNLEFCTNITGEFLTHINQNFEVLKDLSLSSTEAFNVSNLVHISGRLPALKNLKLSRIPNLTDAVIGNIVQGAQKLESLDLSSSNIGNDGLKSIASNCLNLKKLILINCKSEFNAGIGYVVDGCSDLQELNLSHSSIDDSGFENIAKKPRKLIKLNLSNCSEITDEGLKSISIGCPALRSILLDSCNITDDGILHLSNGVKSLQDISIDYTSISSKSIEYILKWRDSLEDFSARDCRNIDDEALTHFSPGLPNLRYLALNGIKNISSDGLRDFAKWFPCLNELFLAYCDKITDSCLPYLKEIPRLENLSLSHCNITNAGLREIIHFQTLRKIFLIECKGLSREEIENLRNGGIEVGGQGTL